MDIYSNEETNSRQVSRRTVIPVIDIEDEDNDLEMEISNLVDIAMTKKEPAPASANGLLVNILQ